MCFLRQNSQKSHRNLFAKLLHRSRAIFLWKLHLRWTILSVERFYIAVEENPKTVLKIESYTVSAPVSKINQALGKYYTHAWKVRIMIHMKRFLYSLFQNRVTNNRNCCSAENTVSDTCTPIVNKSTSLIIEYIWPRQTPMCFETTAGIHSHFIKTLWRD